MDSIKLEKNSRLAEKLLESCELCPRRCRVNRVKGQKGFCGAGSQAAVYNYFPHPGEEPPLSGTRGSGTIFFTYCTMRCIYCQNYSFSQLSGGKEVSTDALAGMMLSLQEQGCHNINLVTPAHFIPQILQALKSAVDKGLSVPIVYNTSGYDSVDALKLLEGIVDIYLTDARYGDDAAAKRFSNAPDYVNINRKALTEMFRQAGNLVLDEEGIAQKGVILRHLILPGGLAASEKVFKFISEEISKDIYISLMSQYHPAYRAAEFPELNRRIEEREYEEAFKLLLKYGFSNGWIQEPSDKMDLKLSGTNIKKMN